MRSKQKSVIGFFRRSAVSVVALAAFIPLLSDARTVVSESEAFTYGQYDLSGWLFTSSSTFGTNGDWWISQDGGDYSVGFIAPWGSETYPYTYLNYTTLSRVFTTDGAASCTTSFSLKGYSLRSSKSQGQWWVQIDEPGQPSVRRSGWTPLNWERVSLSYKITKATRVGVQFGIYLGTTRTELFIDNYNTTCTA